MFTPFTHQTAACEFLLDGGTLLAHDPGTGKTFSTLLACESDPLGGSNLIGCPSIAVGVWEREIALVNPRAKVLILTAKTRKRMGERWDYVVTSLDLIGRNPEVRKTLREHCNPERVIIDECHNLKSPTALRTRRWLLDADALITKAIAARRWLLSGTPSPNHAGELYPLLAGTRPDLLEGRTYEQFTDRFCRHKMARRPAAGGGTFSVRVIAGTNLTRVKELRTILAGWWQRVRKADVLKDLPAKLFRTVPIDIGKIDKEVARLSESPEGRALIEAIENGQDMELDDEHSMSRFRSLISEAKAPFVADYVRMVLDAGEPGVLVWFWHRDGMDVCQRLLEAAGVRTCRIDGTTPQARRRPIEEQFQHPDGPPVFIGQIKAAGTAITMTKAAYEVFAEASWNPAENWQAADRAHRIGQTRGVVCDFLAVKGTLDMGVLSTCERKTREIEELERPI